MTITLIIARHGNTFEPDEIPTRVGKYTDLKLAKKGYEQGYKLGFKLLNDDMVPNTIFASTLVRTQDTAKAACEAMGIKADVQCLDIFDEIDYGPDENKPEDLVVGRIGQQAINDWNDYAIVPDGWCVDPDKVIDDWQKFALKLVKNGQNKIVLVVTSNGIARFAPYITGDYDDFYKKYPLKLRTGAYGILKYDDGMWHVECWDERP